MPSSKSAKPTKGTVVAFGNTPQAKDDSFSPLALTEDSVDIIELDVMDNDSGGKAKSLWSIDDGISEGGVRPVDLLTKDLAGAPGSDTSALGASILITPDGKVAYQLTDEARAELQSLNEGESVVDSFTYAIQLGNGALSWATANVTIAGTKDGPVAVDDGAELIASSGQAGTGTTVSWVDWQSATFVSQEAGRNAVYEVQGTITLPDSHTIDVTYTGQYSFAQLAGGTYYYTESALDPAYTSAEVANAPPTSDIIALDHADSARKLSFSEPVENLFFAIVSMNNNGYLFDQDFEILSYGPSYWGDSAGADKIVDGEQYGITTIGYSPNEFHGVLKVDGAVDSLTWTSQGDEGWNGFTVGTYGIAQSATVSGNVLDNDIKVDASDLLEVSSVNGTSIDGSSVTVVLSSGAIVKVEDDGDYFYDDNSAFAYLELGETITDSFDYTLTDNNGLSDTATVEIVITGQAEVPLVA